MQWELLFVGTVRSTYLTDPFDLFFLFSLLLFLGVFCFKIYHNVFESLLIKLRLFMVL